MFKENLIEFSGWVYFLTWSLSFYPQVILNYKLKNVEGMNLDFLALNISGYVFYTVYCTYGYFYKQATLETGQVDLHDLLFVYHALLITLITVVQAIIYPKGRNKISAVSIGYIITISSFLICYAILTYGLHFMQPRPQLSPVCFMGYFKLSISFLKCWPQMIWNFKRKSTKGWSTSANVLDLIGGCFAFFQIWMQKQYLQNVQINSIKLILAVMSMFYNTVFIVQALCLYPESSEKSINQKQYAKLQYGKQSQRILETNFQDVPKLDQYVITPVC